VRFRSLLGPGVEVDAIRVTNRTVEKAAQYAGDPRVAAYATDSDVEANRAAVAGAKLVLVAVKPAVVPALLAEIASAVEPGTVVVSVAVGVTAATFEAALPESVSVLRAMPNTPALIGRAVTGVSPGARSSDADLALVRALFETVGEVVVVPESKLDALSTISGSGPAYVFYLIEQFTAAAIAQGFPPEHAAQLVNGTFLGSVEMLAATGTDPAALRRQVTSPKGTTERAVAVLESADLAGLFGRATDAALARARELAAGT
jgi:pyrroline-5-carboxylate reductase